MGPFLKLLKKGGSGRVEYVVVVLDGDIWTLVQRHQSDFCRHLVRTGLDVGVLFKICQNKVHSWAWTGERWKNIICEQGILHIPPPSPP